MSKALFDERELTAAVDLCLADGRLNRAAVGWSRTPLHRCNLPASLARKKRWNYWCVTSDELLLSATIVDLDIAQLAFAYYYDRATQEFAERTIAVASGTAPMPETPAGDIALESRGMRVALLDDGGGTRLIVDADEIGGKPVHADVHVERPQGHETLNVVIPWSDEQFQFTSKQNTLPATGSVRIGERAYALRAPSFACLDYGRGVWPEETRWNWGAASGVQGRRVLGLNLGGGWTDGTGMTENALCIDGRLTKISEDLAFEYNRADVMRPWRIRSTVTDRIDLRFTPEYERVSKGGGEAYYSEIHQVFGNYDGRIVGDDGAPIELRALFGWIEDHVARW
jgi:hypothetical protein